MQNKIADKIKLYTVCEIAAILKLQYRTVLKIIERGDLTYINLNFNKENSNRKCFYRIEHKELQRYLNIRRNSIKKEIN
jgi:hypothetical protein